MHYFALPLATLVLTDFFVLSTQTPTDKPKYYHVESALSAGFTDLTSLPLSIYKGAYERPGRQAPSSPADSQSSPSSSKSEVTNMSHAGLNKLPRFQKFLGVVDLKTGTYVIAALGVVQLFFSGCTLFMGISYLIITMWILYITYTILSVVLFFSLVEMMNKPLLILSIWVWYGLIFVAMMILLMILLGVLLCINGESNKLFVIAAGLLWYVLTIYFIFVVNSYRMQLSDEMGNSNLQPAKNETNTPIQQKDDPNNNSPEQIDLRSDSSNNPPYHNKQPLDQTNNNPNDKEEPPKRRYNPTIKINKSPLKFVLMSFQDPKPTHPYSYPHLTSTPSTILLVDENWAINLEERSTVK